MSGQAKPAGRLSLKLIQAVGKAEDDKSLWDDSFQQGFVKGQPSNGQCTAAPPSCPLTTLGPAAELRATSKNVKVLQAGRMVVTAFQALVCPLAVRAQAQSTINKVSEGTIQWNEELTL